MAITNSLSNYPSSLTSSHPHHYPCAQAASGAVSLVRNPPITEVDPSFHPLSSGVSLCTANYGHMGASKAVSETEAFSSWCCLRRSRNGALELRRLRNPKCKQFYRIRLRCNGSGNSSGPDDEQDARKSSTVATEEPEEPKSSEPPPPSSSDDFKSILPDCIAKFDVSMAGPLAGGLLSFAMLGVGLLISSSPEAANDLIQVPSMLFQGSLLLGVLSRAALGYDTMHAATVSIHPLVLAGWCGLTTTAFNLLPVGCLDGGRAIQAAFGKGALTGFALITYLLLGLGVLGGPLSLPWGLYILICQRDPEKPCLNDVSEVGTWRQAAFGLALLLVVLTLLPLWDGLAEELGIGLGAPLI